MVVVVLAVQKTQKGFCFIEKTAGLQGKRSKRIKRMTDLGDIEIVGLAHHSNGRSCTLHEVCGRHVMVGDVLRLVKTVVTVNNIPEEGIVCVKVIDGVDSCKVGFVPRMMASLDRVQNHLNKFVVVKELYESSDNSYKRVKSHKNMGMACVALLDENAGRDE